MNSKTILSIVTTSPEETEKVGESFAELLLREDSSFPSYIAMYGNLGVGKTAFVRGVARILAPGCAVRSPTFAIVNEYRSDQAKIPLYHFDMYRINSDDDLYSCGYEDYLDEGYCIVEWSENILDSLPREHIKILIEKIPDGDEYHRKISIFQISNYGGSVC